MKKIKYKIYTLGCKVNQYDSNVLSGMLTAAGFALVKNKADLIIINTCCVTKIAARKSRQMMAKAKNSNPGAKIVMFGCFPVIYPDEVKKLPADLISGVGDFDGLIKSIFDLLGIKDSCDFRKKEFSVLTDKKRYTLKVQEGCEQYCAYCIIPFTRGKLKSRPMNEILEEVNQAIKHGYNEIVVTGTHLGLYDNDGKRLIDLLKEIIKLKGLGRIRLSSIEINEVSDKLLKLIFTSRKICNHLHVSLQSGSDNILKLMNRPYDSLFFKERILKIKKVIPDIAITTDIIVGFPGETSEDFMDSCNLAKELGFSRVHVFAFSAHERTPAARMKGAVKSDVIKERSKKIRILGQRLAVSFKESFQGKVLDVSVRKYKDGIYTGTTEQYFEITFDGAKIVDDKDKIAPIIGKIVKVRF